MASWANCRAGVRPLGRVGFADAAMIVNDHLIAIDQGPALACNFHGAPGQPVPETNKNATPLPKDS